MYSYVKREKDSMPLHQLSHQQVRNVKKIITSLSLNLKHMPLWGKDVRRTERGLYPLRSTFAKASHNYGFLLAADNPDTYVVVPFVLFADTAKG
jgi:hypothetical protein